VRAYLPLLRLPGSVRFCVAALVGRMPLSMLGIGSVLLVQDRRGSYALAGAVAAAYAVGAALFGPQVSRVVDRRGQSAVLPTALAVHAVALLGLVGTAGTGLPGVVLLLEAALVGAALPPLGACVRARWGALLRREQRPEMVGTAFALESVLDEVVFVAGPALVVGLAVLVDPAAGLLSGLALSVAGTVAFVAQRGTEPAVETGDGSRAVSALRVPGLRTTALSMVFVGVVFGALEVGMVAFADEQGSPSAAGVLLPLVAVGSGVAGLFYGARTWRTPLDRRFLVGLAGLVVGVVPLLLAPGVLAMAPAGVLAGLAISPTLIASFGVVEDLVPVRSRTEGFTWLNSGLGAGVAVGSALAGALADGPGARAGFAVCLAGALLALAAAVVGRGTLAPAAAAV